MRVSKQTAYCTMSVTMSPCGAPPAAVAVIVICDVPSGVGVAMFRNADPAVDACADVAVTVTPVGLGTPAGALYMPEPSMVPFEFPPSTAQVTVWSEELFTVAVNCCCVTPGGHELPVSSAYSTVPAGGLTVTVTGVCVRPPPPTPPQESSASKPSARQIAVMPTQRRESRPDLTRPVRVRPTTPASATQANMSSASGCEVGPRLV